VGLLGLLGLLGLYHKTHQLLVLPFAKNDGREGHIERAPLARHADILLNLGHGGQFAVGNLV
jgi:hypothetical protein